MRPIRLLALSLILFLGPHENARATTWALSTINPNNSAGNRPSLRLGAQDLPRVAHWYIGVGIRYAEFDGAQWHDEPVEPSAPANVPPAGALPNSTQLFRTVSLALALDAAGNPWIAHALNDEENAFQGLLQVSTRQGGVWSREDLETTNASPEIEVDGAGTVHAVYSSSLGLRHAARVAGTWTYETIDPDGGTYFTGPSSALDAGGRLHVAYWANSPPGIRYAVLEAGVWHPEIVDTTANVSSPALAVDAQGRPRIAYVQGPYTASRMRYAERQGPLWAIEEVAGAGTRVSSPSLTLAPDGAPLISYYDGGPLQLRVAMREGEGWSTQVVDSLGNSGASSSAAITAGGSALIAYRADYGIGLRLARAQGLTAILPEFAAPSLRIHACVPNPARAGGTVSLLVDSPIAERATLEAYDASGRRLGAGVVRALSSGSTRIEWTPRFRSGVCFLRVRGESGHEVIARLAVLP